MRPLGVLLLLGCRDEAKEASPVDNTSANTDTTEETGSQATAATGDTGLCPPVAATPVDDPPCDDATTTLQPQATHTIESVAVAQVMGEALGDQFGFELAVWQQHVLASTPIFQDYGKTVKLVSLSLPDLVPVGSILGTPGNDDQLITAIEAKDIDGDGIVEIGVGQLVAQSPFDDSDGAAHVVVGLPDGDVPLSDTAILTVYGPEYTYFGRDVAFAALGSDPCEVEFVVGAGGNSYLELQGGIWATDPHQSGEHSWQEAKRSIRGAFPFGARFDTVDLDGDGQQDIASNNLDGVVYFSGPWEGSLQETDRMAAWTGVQGDLGDSVESVGDLDGDGYEELAFASPHYPEPEDRTGRAYLVRGGVRPVGSSPADDLSTRFEGQTFGEGMGWAIDSGDLDGDGQQDLVIGAAAGYAPAIVAGQVLVYPGPICEGVRTAEDAAIVITGESEGDALGRALAITDADGDGRDDILATATSAPRGASNGILYLVTAASLGL